MPRACAQEDIKRVHNGVASVCTARYTPGQSSQSHPRTLRLDSPPAQPLPSSLLPLPPLSPLLLLPPLLLLLLPLPPPPLTPPRSPPPSPLPLPPPPSALAPLPPPLPWASPADSAGPCYYLPAAQPISVPDTA
eukprot:250223-Rhodomonas_salina.3